MVVVKLQVPRLWVRGFYLASVPCGKRRPPTTRPRGSGHIRSRRGHGLAPGTFASSVSGGLPHSEIATTMEPDRPHPTAPVIQCWFGPEMSRFSAPVSSGFNVQRLTETIPHS